MEEGFGDHFSRISILAMEITSHGNHQAGRHRRHGDQFLPPIPSAANSKCSSSPCSTWSAFRCSCSGTWSTCARRCWAPVAMAFKAFLLERGADLIGQVTGGIAPLHAPPLSGTRLGSQSQRGGHPNEKRCTQQSRQGFGLRHGEPSDEPALATPQACTPCCRHCTGPPQHRRTAFEARRLEAGGVGGPHRASASTAAC